ncbi:hypothetical protein [Penaeicola halotolerans]|nr:hypothetical protein [Penaeicola halotolerans]
MKKILSIVALGMGILILGSCASSKPCPAYSKTDITTTDKKV